MRRESGCRGGRGRPSSLRDIPLGEAAFDTPRHAPSTPLPRRGRAGSVRYPVALRPDQIEQLANVLNVSVEYLFGRDSVKSRGKGPAGKLRQVFEKASQLPRHQQNKVAEFVEAFVERQSKPA